MPFSDGTADFRSDTVTRPTDEMRKAMAAAEVGDDVYSDDPTANALEEEAAEVVGKEAAVFVPTGTMGNQLAIMLQTRPGDDVLSVRGFIQGTSSGERPPPYRGWPSEPSMRPMDGSARK